MYHSFILIFFFFSSRRRHTRLQGDWSSDVCSSDLAQCDRVTASQKVSKKIIQIPVEISSVCNEGSRGSKRFRSKDRRRKRSEEHTSELQSPCNLVCRLLLEKKKKKNIKTCIFSFTT